MSSTVTQLAQLSLLDAAQSVATHRQSSKRDADRQRALALIDEARQTLNLPPEHINELLNINPDEVTIRDSGAAAQVAVRGLYIFFPTDRTASLTPVLVNKETRSEIQITAPMDDLYEFIYRASIA